MVDMLNKSGRYLQDGATISQEAAVSENVDTKAQGISGSTQNSEPVGEETRKRQRRFAFEGVAANCSGEERGISMIISSVGVFNEIKRSKKDLQQGAWSRDHAGQWRGGTAVKQSQKTIVQSEETVSERSSSVEQCDASPSSSATKSRGSSSRRGRVAKKSIPARAVAPLSDPSRAGASSAKKRRYNPMFSKHFELDVDTALVYIDGSLAARVCSIIKNSVNEITGVSVIESTVLAKKSSRKGKDTKQIPGSSSSGRPPKRSKATAVGVRKEKRRRPSSNDGSLVVISPNILDLSYKRSSRF
ncbi:unnamed protein product [Toxocara canis]|uniref:AT-hook motif nuclear-localized protein n=1 Tax=Toxocara canis TaxID=6265 RepID=A0A183U1E0_TOXCA|nr:unnamed protein product [Toxocara canis]